VVSRTFLNGDDCGGDPVEENDSFRFLLGVVGVSVNGLLRMPWPAAWDVAALVKAGPRLFKDVELSSLRACRLV
jgi:hypothetical protein